jgi:hypothetical protein
MYRIRFRPYRINYKIGDDNTLACYRVYSQDMTMMQMFIKQHNFDPQQTYIENIPDELAGEDDLDAHELKFIRLQSNEDNTVHQIVTSTHLFDLAVDYVTNELSNFLLFGTTILRRDIQAIDVVVKCLESLPYTQILDHLLMDDQSTYNYALDDTSWMNVKKTIDQITKTPDWDAYDLSFLYELIEQGCHGDVMPITLEAYVKSFVELIKGDTIPNWDEPF